jgi:hypothetical protein
MAGNTLTLEFAGDASKLQQAAKKSSDAIENVGTSAKSAGDDFKAGAKESSDFTDRIGKLGAGVTGMTDAVDTAGGALSALNDLQQAGKEKAARLARANLDVTQAQEDYNQALRDGKQAAIDSDQAEVDLEQARLDQTTALNDYNTAVKEHGRNSVEARQAQLDLKQAGVDVKQAQEDAAQAVRDGAQANIDAKGAQLDLNDAMREAHPPELAQWGQQIETFTPLLSAMVGVTGLVTAAQWAWNAAQLASPLTWIILAVIALIAVIVLIATKTDWFQKAWRASWGWIKSAAANTWDFIKKIPGWIGTAFKAVAGFITAPFRAAFNFIASAWNNTVGRLSWTVPGWVPGIGGASISVPHIPKFHSGGVVPGPAGSEMLAILQAGERVIPTAANHGEMAAVTVMLDGDVLVEALARLVRKRGGSVQAVLGGRNA